MVNKNMLNKNLLNKRFSVLYPFLFGCAAIWPLCQFNHGNQRDERTDFKSFEMVH